MVVLRCQKRSAGSPSKTPSIHQFGAASRVNDPDAEWEQLRDWRHVREVCHWLSRPAGVPFPEERPSRRRARTLWDCAHSRVSSPARLRRAAPALSTSGRLSLRLTAIARSLETARASSRLSPFATPSPRRAGGMTHVGRCAVLVRCAPTSPGHTPVRARVLGRRVDGREVFNLTGAVCEAQGVTCDELVSHFAERRSELARRRSVCAESRSKHPTREGAHVARASSTQGTPGWDWACGSVSCGFGRSLSSCPKFRENEMNTPRMPKLRSVNCTTWAL